MAPAWIPIASFFAVLLGCSSAAFSPWVRIDSGELFGRVDRTLIKGRPFYSFLGIPYARPPVEEYRFKEAQPVKPWSGVWNATIPASKCIGLTFINSTAIGQEDCLYLNVYTSRLPGVGRPTKTGLMNVIVYIHGGEKVRVDSGLNQGPDFLLEWKEDMVFVTINYRLGPFGFASTGDDVLPGNNGLKDQVAALKWIQRNIAVFGGNPGSVTITGESAGGASVHYHMLSPQSRGLFHRAIIQSGSAYCHWAYSENVKKRTIKLARHLGCLGRTSKKIVECLRSRPDWAIALSLKNFKFWRNNPFMPFGPTLEPISANRFLPDKPENMTPAQDVPTLFSYSRELNQIDEEDELSSPNPNHKYDEPSWYNYLWYLIDENYAPVNDSQKQEIMRKIKNFSFGENGVLTIARDELIKMTLDKFFKEPVVRAAKSLASKIKSPVYFYEFGKNTLANRLSILSIHPSGKPHGNDTVNIDKTNYSDPHDNSDDAKSVPVMVNMWSSFAETGIPDLGSPATVWSPVSKNFDDPLKSIKITQDQTSEPLETPATT